MKTRVLTFFIVAIASMLLKVSTVCAESVISFKIDHESRIKILTPYFKVIYTCAVVADIGFSILIFYYLKTAANS